MPHPIPAAVAAYLPHLTAALVGCLGDHLVGLALFGSSARGTAKAGSDIDILLVVQASGAEVDAAIARAIAAVRCLPEAGALSRLEVDPTPALLVQSLARFAGHPLILLDIVCEGQILADPRALLRRHFEGVRAGIRRNGSLRVWQPDGTWYWDLKPGMRAGEEVAF